MRGNGFEMARWEAVPCVLRGASLRCIALCVRWNGMWSCDKLSPVRALRWASCRMRAWRQHDSNWHTASRRLVTRSRALLTAAGVVWRMHTCMGWGEGRRHDGERGLAERRERDGEGVEGERERCAMARHLFIFKIGFGVQMALEVSHATAMPRLANTHGLRPNSTHHANTLTHAQPATHSPSHDRSATRGPQTRG